MSSHILQAAGTSVCRADVQKVPKELDWIPFQKLHFTGGFQYNCHLWRFRGTGKGNGGNLGSLNDNTRRKAPFVSQSLVLSFDKDPEFPKKPAETNWVLLLVGCQVMIGVVVKGKQKQHHVLELPPVDMYTRMVLAQLSNFIAVGVSFVERFFLGCFEGKPNGSQRTPTRKFDSPGHRGWLLRVHVEREPQRVGGLASTSVL